jgi:hypothetical protein
MNFCNATGGGGTQENIFVVLKANTSDLNGLTNFRDLLFAPVLSLVFSPLF